MQKNPLEDKIKQRIRATGPLSIADYMAICLQDPESGYYRWRDPLGAQGDFITAPEISQIFGELIGLWAVTVWQAMGRPAPFSLVELGPGRGTLMADALRAASLVPEFLRAKRLCLLESNETLRGQQADRLRSHDPQWYAHTTQLPEGPAIVIANEFLDALPIHQFLRKGADWHERQVGLNAAGDLTFSFSEAPLRPPPPFLHRFGHCDDGAIAEMRPAVAELLEGLAKHTPLAALFIDYGHDVSALGDTFQAVRGHDFVSPLTDPGAVDLTAHVDFQALREAAEAAGLVAHGPLPQGAFLLALGLGARAQKLMSGSDAKTAETIASGARRLVDPAQMGQVFKVMAITSRDLPPPPPFG